MTALATCAGAARTYGRGRAVTVALQPTDCTVGEIMGPSGSGKSTLLHLLAGLDDPTLGTVSWPAIGARGALRPGPVAVIFQGPSLLPALTVLENVALPLVLGGERDADARSAAHRALALLDLDELADKLPEEISGGQAQRVAVARALAGRPRLILADEPTGALDSETSRQIMDLMTEINRTGITVLIVTHDPEVAARTQRTIRLRDGKVVNDHEAAVSNPAMAAAAEGAH
jgi:ABC-type lipoprotein export system ATPase subunit